MLQPAKKSAHYMKGFDIRYGATKFQAQDTQIIPFPDEQCDPRQEHLPGLVKFAKALVSPWMQLQIGHAVMDNLDTW